MDVSRRTLLHGAIGGAAAAFVAAASGGNAAASQLKGPRFPGDPGVGKLYYGASCETDLASWEQQLGRTLALHRTYYKARQADKLLRTAKGDLQNQRLPHLSTKCPGTWADVARGDHDAWLRHISDGLARLNRPVFLTFHHEPENNAGKPGRAPADFVAMQTRIIKLYATRAPKVTIVPVLMGWSFSPLNRHGHPELWNVPTAKIYGVDVYNPFSVGDPKWVSFVDKLKQVQPYAKGRPIAIGEYGCRNDPDDPSRGGTWMRNAFHYARGHNIVSMSYFNSSRNSTEGTWALDGERSAVFSRRLASANVARPAKLS